MQRPGVEPAIFGSLVRRPNHYTTEPPTEKTGELSAGILRFWAQCHTSPGNPSIWVEPSPATHKQLDAGRRTLCGFHTYVGAVDMWVSCRGAQRAGLVRGTKGAITNKIKHAVKLKTSPARLTHLLHNCCSPH